MLQWQTLRLQNLDGNLVRIVSQYCQILNILFPLIVEIMSEDRISDGVLLLLPGWKYSEGRNNTLKKKANNKLLYTSDNTGFQPREKFRQVLLS